MSTVGTVVIYSTVPISISGRQLIINMGMHMCICNLHVFGAIIFLGQIYICAI